MEGKIILITGASSGIGKATAEVLGDGKNKLIICGRRKDRLENDLIEIYPFRHGGAWAKVQSQR